MYEMWCNFHYVSNNKFILIQQISPALKITLLPLSPKLGLKTWKTWRQFINRLYSWGGQCCSLGQTKAIIVSVCIYLVIFWMVRLWSDNIKRLITLTCNVLISASTVVFWFLVIPTWNNLDLKTFWIKNLSTFSAKS